MSKEVYAKTTIVLLGFLCFFLAFDLLIEVKEIGRGGYGPLQAAHYVALRIPGAAYSFLPIACFIGALWAFSALAASSEFTVMRASGMTPFGAIRALAVMGFPIVVLGFLLSEFIVPGWEKKSREIRASISSTGGASVLPSGYWLRDSIKNISGLARERIINVSSDSDGRLLSRVKIYEFDASNRLITLIDAHSAEYGGLLVGDLDIHTWNLNDARVKSVSDLGVVSERLAPKISIQSGLSVSTLEALMVRPEQMSALQVLSYARYLKDSRQDAVRYEIAFWQKIVYPTVAWVMLLLALPAAYLLVRHGGIAPKVFIGVLLGVAFHLLNSLFSHLGILNAWPAPLVAVIPSGLALLLALAMLARVQRG